MNLQAVYNAPGTWITMRGTPTEYNQQTPNQYGPWALGKLCDDAGQIAEIMFSGSKKAGLPQTSLLNMPCLWGVKFDANSQKLKALFNSYAQQGAAPPQSPVPNAYGRPVVQTPAPGASPQPINHPKIDATGTSIEHQVAYKDTVQLACHRKDLVPDIVAFWNHLHYAKQWFDTGTVDPIAMSSPAPIAEYDPNQDDSDLPEGLR